MKVNMYKQAGGILSPATDMDAETMTKFKSGIMYPVEIKNARNPKFHGKVFAFFNFCFSHWCSENKYMNEQGQFDVFRANMTVLAGYYDTYYSIAGEARVEAKSLSYGAMTQDEFEKLYSSLISVAMRKIFSGSDDEVYNKLVGFF